MIIWTTDDVDSSDKMKVTDERRKIDRKTLMVSQSGTLSKCRSSHLNT